MPGRVVAVVKKKAAEEKPRGRQAILERSRDALVADQRGERGVRVLGVRSHPRAPFAVGVEARRIGHRSIECAVERKQLVARKASPQHHEAECAKTGGLVRSEHGIVRALEPTSTDR